MEITDSLDWLNDQTDSISPIANFIDLNQATQDTAANDSTTGEPSHGRGLPLLRLHNWNKEKHYDRRDPDCIHYNFQWKLSQREKIRARQVAVGSAEAVLAPSDYWSQIFQKQLDELLNNKDKFPGDRYIREEANVSISVIPRTRNRSLSQNFYDRPIDWDKIDRHMENLGDLFSPGKPVEKLVTLAIELIYRDASETTAISTQNRRKRGTGTDAQKARLITEAGVWQKVYKHWRCRARYCKQGPHCWPDERGIHRRLESHILEAIRDHVVKGMKAGETAEDVDVAIDIPPYILEEVRKTSRKQEANASKKDPGRCQVQCKHDCIISTADEVVCITGDRAIRLEEYCNYTLAQTRSDRWRQELEKATRVAMDQFIELNSIIQHPKVAADLMIKEGVKPGVALQFISKVNITRWWKECQNP